jgi:hypothetical protein
VAEHEIPTDPLSLWRRADGDGERYRELMREHGLLVPGSPEPLPCGWMPGRPPEPPADPVADFPTATSATCEHEWREYLTCCAEPRPEDPCLPPFQQCKRCHLIRHLTDDEARALLAEQDRDEYPEVRPNG